MRVAKLDDRNRLVGTTEKKKPGPKDIDAGDLRADGSYKWDPRQKTFIPVGFGFGKPKPPSVDKDRAIYMALRALLDGRPIPQECRDWCDWYERHHDQ